MVVLATFVFFIEVGVDKEQMLYHNCQSNKTQWN